MMLLTLRGTPTCYYGDELGMEDSEIADQYVVDPQIEAGRSRDAERTPMPWSNEPNAGFTSPGASPWLPVDPSYHELNVAAQEEDPSSFLTLFTQLLELRANHEALFTGSFRFVDAPQGVLAYLRQSENQRILIVLNFARKEVIADLGQVATQGEVLCATDMTHRGRIELGSLRLGPGDGHMIEVST